MGDKVAARIAATNAGLPIIPGTESAIDTAEVKIKFDFEVCHIQVFSSIDLFL
jgi:biotin carboxylase